MKRMSRGIGVIVAAIVVGSCGQTQQTDQPKVIISLVVDQLRPDFLTRFYDHFAPDGGLRRLVDHGSVFLNAYHAHAVTATALGHASVATGAHPRTHGITGNSFWYAPAVEFRYAAGDPAHPVIGYPAAQPISPANLQVTALSDWMKDADPTSLAYAVAIKDRAASMSAGQRPDGAYWYIGGTGEFATSTYYEAALPDWLDRFNTSQISGLWRDSVWSKIGSPEAYGDCRADSFVYENDGIHVTFPHTEHMNADTGRTAYSRLIRVSPFGDMLTLTLAESLLVNTELGQDKVADYLSVCLSSADYTGHAYGPYSHEIADYYLRLDIRLGQFFSFLDERFGEDGWWLVLSSDHGVLPLPEELAARGESGVRISSDSSAQEIMSVLDTIDFGPDGGRWVPYTFAGSAGIALDRDSLAAAGIAPDRVRSRYAAAIRSLPYVADVFTVDELRDRSAADRPLGELFVNNYYPDRTADLIIAWQPGVLVTSWRQGTNHGSPHRYDTDIPIVFYGSAFPAERRSDRIRSVDIAPTLAGLLGIDLPESVDGVAVGFETAP